MGRRATELEVHLFGYQLSFTSTPRKTLGFPWRHFGSTELETFSFMRQLSAFYTTPSPTTDSNSPSPPRCPVPLLCSPWADFPDQPSVSHWLKCTTLKLLNLTKLKKNFSPLTECLYPYMSVYTKSSVQGNGKTLILVCLF